jgi:hypothetical protein
MKKKTFLSTTSIRFLIDTTSDGPPVLSNANFLIPHVHPWKSKKNEVAIFFSVGVKIYQKWTVERSQVIKPISTTR